MNKALLAGATLAAVMQAATAADPYAGASVDATANFYSLVCGTCPIDSGPLLDAHAGGSGSSAAAIAEGGPGWAAAGRAGFGAHGLPQLGGMAFAEIVVDDSIPKTFFYEVGVFSQVLQRYDYVGSTAQDYRIGYTLGGSLTLAVSDSASLMSAYGGLSVYGSDYSPEGESHGTLLGTDFQGVEASLAGTHPFSVGGSVSFTLNPGDAIYVWAALSVTADSSHQVPGSVDAMDTLALSFAVGDAAQLVPAMAPVPEPQTVSLFTLGLLGLWYTVARRRESGRLRKIGSCIVDS